MALPGLVDSLALLGAESQLKRVIAVLGALFFLHDNTRTRLDDGNRNDVPVGAE